MNAFALHAPSDQSSASRWTASALVIIVAHLALIYAAVAWYTLSSPPGVTIPVIMVDMTPVSAAPMAQTQEVAPGPEMLQTEAPTAPPPEPMQQQVVEQPIEPTPLMEKPAVEAPPEQKSEPTPPRPEPAKIVPDRPKPAPVKPRPVHAEAKQTRDQLPAPRTSAAPKAERQAPAASAAMAGAAARAAAADYRQLVAAHLQRFKQYPGASRAAGEQGAATLSFTVSRSGQVLSSRLIGSSGYPALDAETLAMIRRAQPLPSFPQEMTQGSASFTVPIRFSIH